MWICICMIKYTCNNNKVLFSDKYLNVKNPLVRRSLYDKSNCFLCVHFFENRHVHKNGRLFRFVNFHIWNSRFFHCCHTLKLCKLRIIELSMFLLLHICNFSVTLNDKISFRSFNGISSWHYGNEIISLVREMKKYYYTNKY